MNYESYTASELAADPYFVQWVKQPDNESDVFWSEWLLHHFDKKETVEEARQMVLLLQFNWDSNTEERVDDLWQRISATNRVSGKPAEQVLLTPTTEDRHSWYNWSGVAASILIIALLSALIFLSQRTVKINEPEQNQELAATDRLIRYQTGAGEIKTLTLPDGSEVVLNANSTLTFKPQWGFDREVWLSGEAYFSVKKIAGASKRNSGMAKFTVQTSSLQVQVIGTAFNVSDRRQQAVVVLNSGSIKLQLPSDTTILMEPGELVTYEREQQKLVKKEVKPETYSAWKNSEWILDNLTLEELAARIEETYSVKVEIRNQQHSNGGISGVVPTKNLNILLEALATTLKVKVTRTQNKVIIE
ncbi:hypothetical protein AAE02nite_13920 [Adhaeribacter aerolatus]|uniref:Uncharacterized protein n=1 Tax=Adhaeribacter aerolatus TaxID=670289 RepID=A0A512AVI8_9BACT|nr:FecR domain-containing protein [Adhaeribacter aerolatus]GEO03728.1 hypothetical protein AAE02nite_13920 [Adhaeribacter aerolatus]